MKLTDMKLTGEIVKHKAFGRGQITEFVNNNVTVLFDESKEEKRFLYPSAFGEFLEIENKSISKHIKETKTAIAEKEAENKKIYEERVRLEMAVKPKEGGASHIKNTTAKISDEDNIVFKCIYCDGGESKEDVGYKGVCSDDTIKYNIKVAKHVWCSQPENMCNKYLQGEVSKEEICKDYETTKSEFGKSICDESQMLEIWTVGAGISQKGADKGKPMSLKNVKANSLALLTTKLPHAKEEERFIFAVFLIDENDEGVNGNEGYVVANPKYRIQLSLDEAKELKFWNYYFNPLKPEKIFYGSGLHRYLTDTQAAQVLKKICEIKKGTSEEEFSKELLGHYCEIKKLDIDKLPMTKGALQSI